MPASLGTAGLLGIDVKDLPQAVMGGLGPERHVGYFTIGLGNGIAFHTLVGCTAALDEVGFGLLGQRGFFDSYNVEFRHRDKVFVVQVE